MSAGRTGSSSRWMARVFAFLAGDLPRHRRRLRPGAGAARVEDRRQRGAEGRRPIGLGAASASRRWTGALMVGELALTLVLLAGAGFMMRNFLTLYRLDLGIDTSQLLTMALALPERKYPSLRTAAGVLPAARGTAAGERADRGGDDHEQRADAGRLPAAARHRRPAAGRRPTGADS